MFHLLNTPNGQSPFGYANAVFASAASPRAVKPRFLLHLDWHCGEVSLSTGLMNRSFKHGYRVLKGSRFIERWLSWRSAETHHIQIEPRREPAVEAQLLLAVVVTFFQRGKIHEAEIDRLFYFIGVASCKQYPGDMGFNQFETGGWVIIDRRVLQCAEELGLVLICHSALLCINPAEIGLDSAAALILQLSEPDCSESLPEF